MSVKSAFAFSLALSFVSGVCAGVIFVLFVDVLTSIAFYGLCGLTLVYGITAAATVVEAAVEASSGLFAKARNYFRKPRAHVSNVVQF
jgi:F0F1-type ATP synthase assembly protein I